MKIINLLLLVVVNLFGQTLLGEPLNIYLSKDLVNHRQFGAAIVSNQLGEILYTYSKTEEVLQDDLVITVDIDTSENASVTIIRDRGKSFYALTYVNVFNDCQIEDDQLPKTYENRRKHLLVNGVSSLEEIKMYNYSLNRLIRNSLDGNQLSVFFLSRVHNDDYIIFKLNGENQRRYFYSDMDASEFEIQLEELGGEINNYQLNLFKVADWNIELIGLVEATGNKVDLYDTFIKNVNKLNFSIPSEIDINKFHIYLHSNDVEYYAELDQIPGGYEEIDIEIISKYIDSFGFEYGSNNDEIDFFQVDYKYDSSSSAQRLKFLSEWTVIGLFQDKIQYDLPTIPEEIVTKIPLLEYVDTPISSEQKLGIIFTEDIEEGWIKPNQFMRKNWRIEKGVNIKSLYHYFGR